MTENQQLLAEYADSGSESAFRELVSRYLDLVYSTAVRLVNGDTHRAEDVIQMVFADLARQARSLSSGAMLGGWLHRHTCFVASTMVRGERRRQDRERQVAEMNALEDHSEANLACVAPILDEAINQLGNEDRTAILLRFFERNDFRAIGQALGSNEDAAQKRVSRALEKLQVLLRQRGVTFSVAALGAGLMAEAVTAAPVGLAVSVSSAALATAAGVGTTLTIIKLMTITKLKLAAISAAVVLGVGTPLVLQHQTAARLREENDALRQQLTEMAALKAQNEENARLLALSKEAQAKADDQTSQVLKFRNEVAALRKQTNNVGRLQAENQRLMASLNEQKNKAPANSSDPERTEFPREKWAFAGYATPEAASQTMAWAALNYDIKTITNSVAPELLGYIRQLEAAGKFESEFLAGMRQDVDGISTFKIVGRETLPDDQIRLTVTIPGKGERNPVLKRIGNEWKFVQFN